MEQITGRVDFAEALAMPLDEDMQEMTGLEALGLVEQEMRKHDLDIIGRAFLTFIAEANHGSWDSIPREELIGFNNLLADFTYWLKDEAQQERRGFTFGSVEQWDASGKRLPL